MVERVFLGWDRPFLTEAAAWLLDRGVCLARWVVVVPTSQGGRRLREALAEQAGALLTPRITTPGAFLTSADPTVAAPWIERVAWVETLEAVRDWSPYQELFPVPPTGHGEWAAGLAAELTRLRHTLQENGHLFATAAKTMVHETGRWAALAALEDLLEQRLTGWGYQSRSRLLAAGVGIPDGLTEIVLAGVTEMPPLLQRALESWPGTIRVLIGAPPEEAAGFSRLGRPLRSWSERTLPWPQEPHGSVRVTADPRQQAVEALRLVAAAGTASHEVALGTADAAAGDELARTFSRHGWQAFHPAAKPVLQGVFRWLRAWTAWLDDPRLSAMADLLALPETRLIIATGRATLAKYLARLRDESMAVRPDDLHRHLAHARLPSDDHRRHMLEVAAAMATLEQRRQAFLTDFPRAAADLLERLAEFDAASADACADLTAWLAAAAPLMSRVQRGPCFWLDLMLSEIPPPAPVPPDHRAIDIQGWLELYLEPGRHLVLCGLNEGIVPSRSAADPWLGETARRALGLTTHDDRAARDAFLYHSMLAARRREGRVDVLCTKTHAGGESLLPSRLLLATDPANLPQRVKFLFAGIEPPEAGLRWHRDWQWQPRRVATGDRLYVTSLPTYLRCPFRFYLQYVVGMRRPEPDRVEWHAQDFGTATHEIMEAWGRDPAARELTDPSELHAWLCLQLDQLVASRFGPQLPLALQIQTEVLRQRLAWFAHQQSRTRLDGWQTIEVERKITINLEGMSLVAKIDRIDRHHDGTIRIIDYKTGRIEGVEQEHRKKLHARSRRPSYLTNDCPARHDALIKQKPVDCLWVNLQLPLYALALTMDDPSAPVPRLTYFTLGATAADVRLMDWIDFTPADLAAARRCAEWVIRQIQAGVFWPPEDHSDRFDDLAPISTGRPLAEMCAPIP